MAVNWTCPKCGRIFKNKNQMHSCKKYPIDLHFKNKDHAKNLYIHLLKITGSKIGKFKEISLPCCIHWFGNYDFIALLPKRDKLEVRFALDEKIKSKRIFATAPLSKSNFKNCLYICKKDDIDSELMGWLKRSYCLK